MITLKLGQVCVGKRTFQCRRIPHNHSNTRFHWATKAKWNDVWKEEIFAVWNQSRLRMIKLPLKTAKIKITLYMCKLMDYDGAYNCIKPLLDALKINGGIGIIVDDSPKYIDLEVKQIKTTHRKNEYVLMEID